MSDVITTTLTLLFVGTSKNTIIMSVALGSDSGKKSHPKFLNDIGTTAQVDASALQGETGTMIPNVPIVLFEQFYTWTLTYYNVIIISFIFPFFQGMGFTL